MLQATLPLIHKAALDACDALDGVTDGVIDNPRQCRFDPAVLTCRDSGASGDANCLTPLQVETVRAIYAPIADPRTGAVLFPGLEPGSELGWTVVAGAQPENNSLDLFKYIVFNDANWDWKTFTLAGALDAIGRTAHIDAINAVNPDLRPYLRSGRKAADVSRLGRSADAAAEQRPLLRPRAETVGDEGRVQLAPALHGSRDGTLRERRGHRCVRRGLASRDWVERGDAPVRIEASRLRDGKPDRTRPLCAYPNVARWTGRGSSNDAANFTCTAP